MGSSPAEAVKSPQTKMIPDDVKISIKKQIKWGIHSMILRIVKHPRYIQNGTNSFLVSAPVAVWNTVFVSLPDFGGWRHSDSGGRSSVQHPWYLSTHLVLTLFLSLTLYLTPSLSLYLSLVGGDILPRVGGLVSNIPGRAPIQITHS